MFIIIFYTPGGVWILKYIDEDKNWQKKEL